MKKLSKFVVAVVALTVLFGTLGFAKDVSDYDQYLINALKDDNHGIRTSAAQLLGERRVEAAVKPLLKMLKTENKYACRIIVAKALYDIGDKRALPELKKVAKFDRNKTVRRVVTAIVKEMQTVRVAQKITR
ncbi:HEAT repeat domain-containing protein [candidate division KSB1 bacterium]|nr:HEAT repeat domain-containing protein [candidate division KSB1 bacterium]